MTSSSIAKKPLPIVDPALLLASGSEYLRYERGCYLVTWQRGPWPKMRPDILGVTAGRKTLEIEVKTSLYDFRANRHKRGQRLRARGRDCPHQFYFLVPPRLVEKIRAELPAGAGLLTVGGEQRISGTAKVEVIVGAAVHRRAVRLGLAEIVKLVRHQSGTLCSAAAKLARLSAQRRALAQPPPSAEAAKNGMALSSNQKRHNVGIENQRAGHRRAKAAE